MLKTYTITLVPLVSLAQLDITGYLAGPEGRGLAANLFSSLLLNLVNAIIGAFFNITI